MSASAGLNFGTCPQFKPACPIPHQCGTLGVYPVKILACCNHTVDVGDHLLLRSSPHLINFLLGDACSGKERICSAFSGLSPKKREKSRWRRHSSCSPRPASQRGPRSWSPRPDKHKQHALIHWLRGDLACHPVDTMWILVICVPVSLPPGSPTLATYPPLAAQMARISSPAGLRWLSSVSLGFLQLLCA